MRTFIVALFFVSTCCGCNVLRPGIPGSGKLQSEFRNVEPFQQVDLSGIGTVQVFVGEQPSVQVATDHNLLPHVETSVESGVLKVRTRGSIRPRSGINITVTAPHLAAARVSGAGTLHAYNVTGESLEMTVSGAGTLTADGQVHHLRTRISGAGDAELKNLITHSADVRISGAGDASVYAMDSLTAHISGAGDLNCFGNPAKVNQKVSGAGDINLVAESSDTEYFQR